MINKSSYKASPRTAVVGVNTDNPGYAARMQPECRQQWHREALMHAKQKRRQSRRRWRRQHNCRRYSRIYCILPAILHRNLCKKDVRAGKEVISPFNCQCSYYINYCGQCNDIELLVIRVTIIILSPCILYSLSAILIKVL